MFVLDLLGQFVKDMWRRRLRTVLALFGIAWGTTSVVLLLSIGDAFQAASSKAFHGMGDAVVVVWTGRTTKPFAGMQPGRSLRLKSDEVIRMGRDVPGIGMVSPELTHWGSTLVFGDHRVKVPVSGIVPEYEIMRNMIPVRGGRFIDPLDVAHHRRAIFIGNELKDKLFGEASAVGETILMDGRPFVVVGTLQKKIQTSSYSGPDADRAYIPYTTFISMWGDGDVSDFLLTANPPAATKALEKAVYRYLGAKFRFDPSDKDALRIWNAAEMSRVITWFFWGLKALFGLGGALTLGAGGIGVANIMFLIVRERTREIGIRMAVGARDAHVMGQVMLEALLIVVLGGAGGFLFSAMLIGAIGLSPTPDWLGKPELSVPVSLVTMAILAFVGVTAGYFPARRAARMDPVRALEF